MFMKINRLNQVYASILIDAIYQMKNYPITLVSNVIAPFSVLILIILVSHGQLLGISIAGALIISMILWWRDFTDRSFSHQERLQAAGHAD